MRTYVLVSFSLLLLFGVSDSFFWIPFYITTTPATTGSTGESALTGSSMSGVTSPAVPPTPPTPGGRRRRQAIGSSPTSDSSSLTSTGSTAATSVTTSAAPKPGTCPLLGAYSPWCGTCTLDSQCPGIQKCCPAGYSGRNCCFAVLLTG